MSILTQENLIYRV